MNVQAEAAVKKLSKLPANQNCANCGTTQRHGFSTVCIKYHTFVCNLCKTAHQAVSHRCKSLTMSSWDTGEVLTLKKHGNDYARRVWLANAPNVGEGGRPREGDNVNVFKRFVVTAYDQKKYYQDTGGEGDGPTLEFPVELEPKPSSSRVPSNAAKQRSRRKKKIQPARVNTTAAPAPTQPVVDLLDFGAVEVSTPLSAPAPPVPPESPDFGDFSDAAVPIAAVSAPPATFDPFGNNDSLASAAASMPVSKQMSSLPTTIHTTSNSTNDTSFDPFNSPSGGVTSFGNSNSMMQQQQSSQPHALNNSVMNHNMNIMSGGNNMTNSSSMMSNTGSNSGGLGNGNAGTMMNNIMQNGMTYQQQQTMMMQQQQMMMMQQQQRNTFNMPMNGQQGSNGMMQNGGMNHQQQHIMMQHHNNNFGMSMSNAAMSSNNISNDGKKNQFAF